MSHSNGLAAAGEAPKIQKFLTKLSHVLSETDGLELVLKIAYKITQLFALSRNIPSYGDHATQRFSASLVSSIEILGVSKLVGGIQELTCVNEKGHYLLRTARWEKCVGRIFLLCYSILATLEYVCKLGAVRLAITALPLGYVTVGYVATQSFYALYYVCRGLEGAAHRNWFTTATATGKICSTVFSMLLKGRNITYVPALFSVTALSCAADLACFSRMMDWV